MTNPGISSSQNIIVSLPRCGQHMTSRLLSDLYNHFNKEYSYCEYSGVSCCRSIPCELGKQFIKNHDFKGYIKIDPSIKYLVLYRDDKIDQLEAYFRFKYCAGQKVGSRGLKTRPKPDYSDLCTFKLLTMFIHQEKDYYDSFIDKWVNTPHDNVICLDYEYIVNNTVSASQKMLEFFNPGETFGSDDIINCLSTRDEQIEPKYEFDSSVKKQLVKLNLFDKLDK